LTEMARTPCRVTMIVKIAFSGASSVFDKAGWTCEARNSAKAARTVPLAQPGRLRGNKNFGFMNQTMVFLTTAASDSSQMTPELSC
jgi:hypothetical protein